MTSVPVPHRCSSIYLVATPVPVEDPQVTDLPLPPDVLLTMRGATEGQLERLHERTFQSVVHIESSAADAAETALAARREALDLAEQHDGIVVDLLGLRIIDQPSTDVRLYASAWVTFDYDELAEGKLRTEGLEQFGLPEVQIAASAENHAMVSAVVTGLAQRLITEWPANDPVGPATVTLRDIAFGLGDSDASETPEDRSVRLDIAYDPDDHLLLVTLHDDPARTLFQP